MNIQRFRMPILIGVVILSGSAASCISAETRTDKKPLAPGTHRFAIDVEGVERSYLVHAPAIYNRERERPVVVMFHGGGGTAEDAIRETGWDEKAEKEGFLAVFPEGTRPDPNRRARFSGNPQTWNDGSMRTALGAVRREVPDIAYVSEMLDDLKRRFRVDERRIYVTGFSNGASLAFRLARERSQTIAAAAPVAGSDWQVAIEPARPVPIFYITGTEDPLNPHEGGEMRIGWNWYGVKPATVEMLSVWLKMHGVQDDERAVHDRSGAKGVAYGPPNEPPRVVLYALEGHGHHWPGGRSLLPRWLAGQNSATLNATDVIWDFFRSHALPDMKTAQQTNAAYRR